MSHDSDRRFGKSAAWSAAITGIVFSSIFINETPPWPATTIHRGVGWTGVFSAVMVWRHYGLLFIRPLIIGAVAYIVGAGIDVVGWPTSISAVIGPRELFHVAVLIGDSCCNSLAARGRG